MPHKSIKGISPQKRAQANKEARGASKLEGCPIAWSLLTASCSEAAGGGIRSVRSPMARLRGRATPVRRTVAPPAHHHDWRSSDKVTFTVRVLCSNWTRISRVRAETIAHAQQVTIVSTKVARDRLLRLLALEAAGSQSVVSGESGQLEVAMAAIWYVPRPRLVAWGSCDDLSFASIDLTVHRGGLVVGVGGRPRVAWAPLPRLPTHTAPGRTHVRSAPDRREVGGAPLVRLARLGPRAISPCFYETSSSRPPGTTPAVSEGLIARGVAS